MSLKKDRNSTHKRLEKDVRRALAELPNQLRILLELRYGFSDRPRYSYRRLAKTLGVSVWRIQKAEAHALRWMVHPGPVYADLGLQALNVSPPPIELYDAIEKIKRLTPDLIGHLKREQSDLTKIRWDVFEHLIGEFLAAQGFRDVRLVGRDPRTSADIYATWIIDSAGLTLRFFVEVKRWRDRVGVQVINEVIGAMLSERERVGWHASIIIATGGFAEPRKFARPELSLRGVDLKDRQDLLRWLDGYKPNKNGLWLPSPPRELPASGRIA